MKLKILRNTLILFLLQLVLFIWPMMIFNKWLILVCFIINSICSFYYIKDIEKGYYEKYNKWDSMLYMFCPFLGILLLTGIINHLVNSNAFKILMAYYILLYFLILIINAIYIIIKHKS